MALSPITRGAFQVEGGTTPPPSDLAVHVQAAGRLAVARGNLATMLGRTGTLRLQGDNRVRAQAALAAVNDALRLIQPGD